MRDVRTRRARARFLPELEPELNRIVKRTLKHLAEEPERSLSARLWRTSLSAARYAKEVGLGVAFLRACDELGEGVRVIGGRPRVENLGQISVGARACFLAGMGPIVLRTGPAGQLAIGDSTIINFGTLISASREVHIGEGVAIGQYCLICDTDGADFAAGAEARTIHIGDGVWLAARVTVLPGARIGKGSVITAGSIVSGEIPEGVLAGGIPARVVRPLSTEEIEGDVAARPLLANGHAAIENREPAARGYIVSDFTVGELERRLNDPNEAVPMDFAAAPFGQVIPALLAPAPAKRDVLVVWTRPEAVVPAFDALLGYEQVDEAELLRQVDAFCDVVAQAASRYRAVLVPTWLLPPYRRALGMLDARSGGATHALCAMNLRLMERLAGEPGVFVLNAQRWVESVGRNAQQAKLWYLGKVPFHPDVFAEAAADIHAALAGLAGQSRKLLVLDLDDTLWGGVVGDIGYEALRLGGHDSVGEAFADFQRAVKQLKRRGVILALVSKNTESVALEAIRRHPEMVLREEDFVAWRINWQDKAQNIAQLVSELNLGLSSVVFIDDNPVERARVREALPEVLVPEWPEDKLLYASSLRALRCFDTPLISREDGERTALYAAERQREALKIEVGSLDDWLSSLRMEVRIDGLERSNLSRATQLLNKTNQMNLSTRRLTEAELQGWASDPNHQLWTITVSDRFGDAGLTGLVSLDYSGDVTRVVDFVLSCRVMGRKIEETLLHIAVRSAQQRNARRVEALYLETKKNKPCLEFWERSGFSAQDWVFSWDASQPYPCPSPVALLDSRGS
ncbi:MAG TPA: HAD-IIIC family phosphatase [Polyangiaceae bacterium]|nr:HAD-IIIC family phosphatase [Polyangiaceae bacterium]